MVHNLEIDVFEQADDKGSVIHYERFKRTIKINVIDHGAEYEHSCAHCEKYAKNLACPPFSPVFADYVKDAENATVICYRVPLFFFESAIAKEQYQAGHRFVTRLLYDELLEYRKQGHVVAGSGTCLVCKKCAVLDGNEHCRMPEKMIYSLESLGVNIISLTKNVLGLELEWSGEQVADYVSAVGAVFC